MAEFTHEQLAEDLALTLRGHDAKAPYFVARECNLGSAWARNGVPRADVLAVKPSYTKFAVHIYECKASRADFQADVNAGKWQSYLPFCHRLYFACPAGVIRKEDVPEGCGLMCRGEKGWATVKQCRPRTGIEFEVETLLGILVTCGNREIRSPRYAVDITKMSMLMSERERCRIVGRANAERLASLDRLEDEAQRMKETHEKALHELAEALGMPVEKIDPYSIVHRLGNAARGGLSPADQHTLDGMAKYLQTLSNARSTTEQLERVRPKVPDDFRGWPSKQPEEGVA